MIYLLIVWVSADVEDVTWAFGMASKFRKIAISGLAGTIGAGIATYLFLKEEGDYRVSEFVCPHQIISSIKLS